MKPDTMVKTGRSLVACRIFEQALRSVLEPVLDPQSGGKGIQIVWVDSALHCDLDRLEAELTKAVAAAKTTGEDVRMLFGRDCLPEIESLARKHGIPTSPVKNCVEAFLGEQARILEENRTMIMTPTWIRT